MTHNITRIKADKMSEMIFGDWEDSNSKFLDESGLILATEKIESIDQWWSLANMILVRRTFDTKTQTVQSIQKFIKEYFLELHV